MLRLAHAVAMTPDRVLARWKTNKINSHSESDYWCGAAKWCAKRGYVVVADDVRAMIIGGREKYPSYSLERMEGIAMPYLSMFVEFHTAVEGLLGAAVNYFDDPNHSLFRSCIRRCKFTGSDKEQAHSVIGMLNVVSASGVPSIIPVVSVMVLDDSGRCLTTGVLPLSDTRESYSGICGHIGYTVAMTLQLLGCRNVDTSDATSRLGPARKWLQRQKQPEIRYHVLDINPMKQVLRTEGNIEDNGLKKAMHICRGHFATYSEDKPLFGKYAGRFWVPAHVKGSPEHGIVDKDYRIRLPGVSQCETK